MHVDIKKDVSPKKKKIRDKNNAFNTVILNEMKMHNLTKINVFFG